MIYTWHQGLVLLIVIFSLGIEPSEVSLFDNDKGKGGRATSPPPRLQQSDMNKQTMPT